MTLEERVNPLVNMEKSNADSSIYVHLVFVQDR